MHGSNFKLLLLACFIVEALANNALTSNSSSLLVRQTACSTPTGDGTCMSTSSCGGTSVSGYCPGSSDIQCCVVTCSTPSGPGFCENTSSGCSGGTFIAGHCPGASDIQCCVSSCSTSSGNGFCEWNESACPGGDFVAGSCPGPADVQCCVSACETPSGSGNCQYTGSACDGTYEAGYCPGPSDFQCCITGGDDTPPPPSSGSGVAGVDISTAPSSSFWTCAADAYKVVVIRGYQQACGFGGKVDPNFLPTYRAAKAAGIPRVDGYLFPCTGTQPGGVPCKDPQTQLDEFIAEIEDNNMDIGHLWIDIEPTDASNGDPCNAWQLSTADNVALAKKWISLLEESTYTWGVYANGNQWSGMFGTRSTDIGSQLPLWAVQADGEPGVDTVTTFMGGWTSAVAKQYKLDTTGCGGDVDLDSFAD